MQKLYQAKDRAFNFEQRRDKLHEQLQLTLLEDHPLYNISSSDTLNISFSYEIGDIFKDLKPKIDG